MVLKRQILSLKYVPIILSLMVLIFGGPALASTHVFDQGKVIYAESCIACHGSDGAGTMPGIPDLSDKNGPLSKSDEVLLKSILEGVETSTTPTPMPAFVNSGKSTEEGARSVLYFIRHQFSK